MNFLYDETAMFEARKRKAESSRRIYDYLCKTHSIDEHIVSAMIADGKSFQDVWVSAPLKTDCADSDKRFWFYLIGTNPQKLYIFQSPIDALSHATLENFYTGELDAWRRDSRLSLGGTSDLALVQYLADHPETKELILCLDSDNAGRAAAIGMARKYADKGFWTRLELPPHKDYNEMLIAIKGGQRE